MQVSLVLSERRLHEGQNHLFCDDKISGFRNWFIEVCMSVDTGRVTISRFSSDRGTKAGITRNCDFLCYKLNGLLLMTYLLSHLKQLAVFLPYLAGY